jgi:hypothetical protein
MRQSRSPELGDILVVTLNDRTTSRPLKSDVKHVGMIYKIVFDKWGHKNEVFVVWQGDPAPNYNRARGYCGMNIHNLRSEFRVVRNGVDIP